jgi:hypothetical protein
MHEFAPARCSCTVGVHDRDHSIISDHMHRMGSSYSFGTFRTVTVFGLPPSVLHRLLVGTTCCVTRTQFRKKHSALTHERQSWARGRS